MQNKPRSRKIFQVTDARQIRNGSVECGSSGAKRRGPFPSRQWLNSVVSGHLQPPRRLERQHEKLSQWIHSFFFSFPTFTLTLYRHNGSTCLASVDGSPIAYVQRTQAVDLIEAVNQVILGS